MKRHLPALTNLQLDVLMKLMRGEAVSPSDPTFRELVLLGCASEKLSGTAATEIGKVIAKAR